MDGPQPGPLIPIDLSAPGQSLIDLADGLVFERGIEIRRARAKEDRWTYRGNAERREETLAFFQSELQLLPLALIMRTTIGGSMRFLIPSHGGPVLELQAQVIDRLDVGQALQSILNLRYITGALLYHCHGLVREYGRTIEQATEHPVSEDFVFQDAVEPYFEFEALVTTAVRVFETTRYLLWSAFGPGRDCPNNFEDCAKRLPALSPTLAAILTRGLGTFTRAKEYRDCCQHNAHFGARLPLARVTLYAGHVWSMQAWIPDNPEVKSYSTFSYAAQIDALRYGWELTGETCRFVKELVALVPSTT
jgi:hypothetical protein